MDMSSVQDLIPLAQMADLPVYLVTVEGGRIVDVRLTTRSFILTHLAVQQLLQKEAQQKAKEGDQACAASVGRSRWFSD
jgi:hypothetical protein